MAILLVVIHHLQKFAFQRQVLIVPAGFLGVDIFFVLSGFLITCLLLEEWDRSEKLSLPKFYMRRALRLLPALVLFLLCVSAFAAFALSHNAAIKTYWNALYSLFYVSNWIAAFEIAPISEPLGHMWSLAIEEQFYLSWPFLLLGLLKLKISRAVIVAAMVILIAVICFHRWQLVISGVWEHRIYSASDTRADSLLIGCLAAMLLSWRMLPTSQTFLRFLNVASFGGLLIIVAYLGNLLEIAADLTLRGFGFSLFGVAVAVLLIQFATNPPRLPRALLETPVLAWIGRISYGIYLWHLPICIAIAPLQMPQWTKAVIVIVLTTGMASASNYFVERPFLKLKERL